MYSNFNQVNCHQAHWSGAGHVTANIYIQGARTYRSGTAWLRLPSDTPINNLSPIPTGLVLVM